ncbi:MAG: NUDIX hydrolase, partial [Candidatus Limnocylindrales bacterium]
MSARPLRSAGVRAAQGEIAEARPAATVVVLRPGPDPTQLSPEVLLTLRPESMAFGAGLHVFPGGSVDPRDVSAPILERSRSADGHRVAALRELFEEAGVLIADRPDGSPAGSDPAFVAAKSGLRRALIAGEIELPQVLERFELVLATDRLVPVGHWLTPRAYPRRFDARFFAVELPTGAVLDLDPGEVAGHAWLTPGAALAAMAAGQIQLWPPTSTTLQRLERAADIATLLGRLEFIEGLPFTTRDLGGGVIALTGGTA